MSLGKKLNYIIAFDPANAIDVTWKYTKNQEGVLSRRTVVTEEWLVTELEFITASLVCTSFVLPPNSIARSQAPNKAISATEKIGPEVISADCAIIKCQMLLFQRSKLEDSQLEEAETTATLEQLKLNQVTAREDDDHTPLPGRMSGAVEWIRERGEDGGLDRDGDD